MKILRNAYKITAIDWERISTSVKFPLTVLRLMCSSISEETVAQLNLLSMMLLKNKLLCHHVR